MTLQNPAEKETGEAEKALMNPSLFFCLYSRRMKLSWQESIILKQGYIYIHVYSAMFRGPCLQDNAIFIPQ